MNARDAVVVGIGRTRYTRKSAASEHALAAQAIVAAVKDAGLALAAIDGVVRFDRDALWEYDLPGVLGLRTLTFYDAVPFSPGSAPALLRLAAMAVTTGLADVVIGYHARNPAERPSTPAAGLPGGEQFQAPFGITMRVHEAALLLQRHFRHDPAVARAIAATTVAARRNAARNPRAIVRTPLTLAEYRASPVVATPLRAVDCAPPSAGAGAFVVTTRERAATLRRPGVEILATMQLGLPSTSRQLVDWFRTDRDRPLIAAARALFRRARRRPADVDLAYVWNAVGPMALLGLEHYGFCRRGQSGAFVRDGGLKTFALNPNGGQLAEADLDGVNGVVDAVERLRAAGPRAPRCALVTGSPMEPTSAVLLGRATR